MTEKKKIIAVFGATGHQGKGVVQALQIASQFRVLALSRNPQTYIGEADEVMYADLEKPETLNDALKGVHGVFLVTDYWQQGTDEKKQATLAIEAAKSAGVKLLYGPHFPTLNLSVRVNSDFRSLQTRPE